MTMATGGAQASVVASGAQQRTVAQIYAEYIAALRYEDLPAAAIERAKFCLIDAIGCVIFGKRFPWSQMVLDEAMASSGIGPCVVPGQSGSRLDAAKAALVLGAMSHAFELDSLRKPGAGVHPGATVALPALAMAQAGGKSGRDLITAIVAGCEIMFRIGAATLHSSEKLGFHAPGITGVFGAAAASARLMNLSPAMIANAFGVAGSMAGGLLAFAKSGSGGMVKRLHLGRAAESGVVAARLAARGYEGPLNIFEGQYGILDVYCDESDPALLTKGLGSHYEIERICFKRYGCHVTAHAPVQLLRSWIEPRGLSGDDIASIEMEMSGKVISHHDERDPADLMLAQYSVPFTTALAAYHDPNDPRVFSEQTMRDPRVRQLAQMIVLNERSGQAKGWGVIMKITLNNGEVLQGELDSHLGCPEQPLTEAGLRTKFDGLIKDEPQQLRATLFDALMRIEQCDDIGRIRMT
jgi:2-methylcitrate dehydratase PrpD